MEVGKKALRNNLEIQFAESFTKVRLEGLENQTVALSLPAQSVCNDIGLEWSIFNTQIILLNHLDPTSLPEVEVWLSEDVVEALMISEDVAMGSHQIVSAHFQCMDHGCQL